MKNSADLGGCYQPRPSASVDNTLLDLHNSSHPTQTHSIIAKYIIKMADWIYVNTLYQILITHMHFNSTALKGLKINNEN